MTMHTTRTFAVLITASLFASCQKYDDGPFVSLRSREERVANNWQVEEAKDNGNDVTANFDQYELRLTKDRDATLTASYTLGSIDLQFATSGTWEFENKQADLRFDFENNDADDTWEILRLQEEELWLHEKGGNLELHLKPL